MSPIRHLLLLAVLSVCLLCVAEAKADSTPAKSVRTDAYGDPLPPGALLRLGTVRWRACARFLAFTPDGKTLLTGEYPYAGPNAGVIRCWDAATGKESAHFHVDSALLGVALSPDGKTLAVDEVSRGIVFRSVPDGKEIRRIEAATTVPGGNLFFLRLDFSSDGKTLAAVGNDSVVRVIDVESGKTILPLTGEAGGRFSTAFSPDGKKIALVGPKNTLRVVQIPAEKEVLKRQVRPDDNGRPLNVSFSPDGKTLAWVGEDAKTFALWDVGTGKPVLQFHGSPGKVTSVHFSPDGKRIASTSNVGEEFGGAYSDSIRLWDAETGKVIRQLAAPDGAIDEVVFSPDGKRLAAGADMGGVFHLWDVETGKELSRVGEHQGVVCSVAFSPDGRTAFTGCADRIVRVWDADKGTVARRVEVGGTNCGSYDIVFSRDRKTAAVTSFRNNAALWDVDLGKKRADLDGGKDQAWVAVFAPNGKTLASRGMTKGIPLWDAATGKLASRIGIDSNGLGCFAFSPDGKTLAALRDRSEKQATYEMSLWDVARGKELDKWPTRIKWGGFGIQFLPDGRRIAVIAHYEVELWDVAGRKEWAELRVPEGGPRAGTLNCLAYSPDGRTLAAGGGSGVIYLWEVNTTKVRAALTGHRNRITSLDFAPDGSRLISGSYDATALLWDLNGIADEKEAKTLTSERLMSLWDELADADAGKAWRAGRRLTTDPAASVPFLQKHLRPAKVDADRIAKLLTALDGDGFEEREMASRELAKLGDLAGPAMRKALEGNPSLEVRRRLEGLLNKLNGPITISEQARDLRCVEVLEHIGSPDARRLLDELSKGAEGARLTENAKGALARLSPRRENMP